MQAADLDPDFPDRREVSLRRTSQDLVLQQGRGLVEYEEDLEDEESSFNIAQYIEILWKHKFLIAGAIAACLAVGIVVTLLTKPMYRASASLQIDRESAKVVNVTDVTPTETMSSAEEFFQTQYALLKSKSLTQRVISSMGLSRSARFLESVGMDPQLATSQKSASERAAYDDAVVRAVQAGLTVAPIRGSRLVTLNFMSRDPAIAAEISNGFADNFISSNLERKFDSSSYAREFLEKRLAQVKAKLEESERQLVGYASDQQIINLHEGGNAEGATYSQSLDEASLQSVNSAMTSATAERVQAEQIWRQAAGSSGRSIPEVLASPLVQQLSQERASKLAQYNDNLQLYKSDYPAMKALKGQIEELDRQIRAETDNIRNSLKSSYMAALARENDLKGQLTGLKSSVLNFKTRSIQYNILQREADTNRTLYDGLLQRYKEIGVTGGVTTNNISVVDRAEPPLFPSKPQPFLNMALAGLAGLALGVLLAFVVEALDQAIRRPADLEAKVGIPLLGSTPLLAKGVTPIEAMKDLRSDFWEAYYSIRTAMQFTTSDGFPRTLLVTSSTPSEGKSTTSLAIAQSMARMGIRTLLVDGDMRKPSLHNTLGADRTVGFSNYLTGNKTLESIEQPTNVANLVFISAGPLPPTPGELLAGGRLRSFLAECQERYEVIVIDGPPVMGLADAPMISSLVAASVVVVESGKTGRNQVKSTIRRLRTARGRIIGAILTKFDARKASSVYGYGDYEYRYNYGKD